MTWVSNNKDSLLPPTDSTIIYFPFPAYRQEEITRGERKIDSFVLGWYSWMLYSEREPILSTYCGDKEFYRFTWLRSFDNPIVIRLQKNSNGIDLFEKVSDGEAGYSPGKIILDTSFEIDYQRWDTVKNLLKTAAFWNLPARDTMIGHDGAEWILEGFADKNYHWISRFSPRSGPVRQICDYLVSLSKIKIKADRIY